MPLPSELLQAIEASLDLVLQDGGLNPQQLTFVNHIQKTATELSTAIAPIPQTDYALRRIIPGFGDSFLQQQVALFGYARLLLESPESFDDVILSDYQQDEMQAIYQHGQTLYELTDQIVASAKLERPQQHARSSERMDLVQFFERETPVLHYFLRNVPVKLSITAESSTVFASDYHLSALIQHIVTTLALELIEYGHIKISTGEGHQESLINIFCTGIQLDATEIDILFKKNGRYHYTQRLQQDGGTVRFLRERGRGATIQLVLARSKP